LIVRRTLGVILAVLILISPGVRALGETPKVFRAGASAVDVSPTVLPALINGGFLEARSDKVRDPLMARALVLDDGATRLAIVVLDSCMMPRDLLDRAKTLARDRTGIPTDRMLVSATHTHSAPAAMGALGCAPDLNYVELLPPKIAESIAQAAANLRPARIGWGSVDDFEHTHCRRWIRRPDRLITDPFGNPSARAHMHPGYQNPDAIAPSGPVDPELSVLSVQTPEGRPIALLANYSMHYFGASAVSADYFGRFAAILKRLIKAEDADPPFVGMMSQGTSGDQHWMDYSQPRKTITIDEYSEAVARSALSAYEKIRYHEWVPLTMAETTLRLARRVPDERRLAWARPIVDAMGDRAPKTLPEVYAREAIALHDDPARVLKLQALRIGDLGIAAIPDEVYALTGLKIKARSPLRSTFTIELANGSEGYIPPPEQHALGGYTTWPARTAALEVEAEPRIVEAVLGLLEQVAGTPRRKDEPAETTYSKAVHAARPWAYWRLEEKDGRVARDDSGHGRDARFTPGYALYLDGPEPAGTHAVHLAGGQIVADVEGLGPANTIVLWFWNGLPTDARPITGVLLGEVGIGGTRGTRGKLFLARGGEPDPFPTGRTATAVKQWHHLAVVRIDDRRVKVYLDGSEEIASDLPIEAKGPRTLTIGGSKDLGTEFEGKVDEIAVFDRAFTVAEVAGLHSASGMARPAIPGDGR
jgi:hypothetical protein